MKYIKKISTVFCAAALGLLSFTACEGGDIINVNSPDWLSEKIDSINAAEAAKKQTYVPTPSNLGSTDCTTPYLGAFTEELKLEEGKSYVSYFTNLSSCGGNWNNFVIVLKGKDAEVASSYAILRADNWDNISGENTTFNKATESGRDWTEWKEAMNGASCVSTIKNNNGKVDVNIVMVGNNGKTYTQSYSGVPVEADNVYMQFTVDNCALIFNNGTNVKDYEPLSITLNNVPGVVTKDANQDEAMAAVTATVTFEDGMTKTVSYSDLDANVVPDLSTTGTKYLFVTYAKTYFGSAAKSAVTASAPFLVGDYYLEVTKQPTNKVYYYNAAYTAFEHKLNFDPTGMEVCMVNNEGKTVVDNATLTFTTIPAEDGTYDVTVKDANGITTTVSGIQAKSSSVVNSTLAKGTIVGKEDNSTSWTPSSNEQIPVGKTLKYVFTNYGSGVWNWNNFLIEVFNEAFSIYYTVRADNYGWGYNVIGDNFNDPKVCDWDFTDFNTNIQGAEVTAYVTNNGNGYADVECVIKETNGKTFHQAYYGLSGYSADDIWSHLTVDGSHLVIK